MSFQSKFTLLTSVAMVALTYGGATFAQELNTQVTAAAPDPAVEVIVTGRAGTGKRTKAETSYSVTNINEEALRLQAPTSVTEALKSVPGFWVEASGGEASGNVRARGVPVDGYGSITLLEDGIAVAHDPALGYLNVDQVFRVDETIDRIEVVRGGPSAVFYSNAPAGAVNFIPRKVGAEASGLVKATVGQDGLFRTDFWYGAPIGDWKASIGGFYRNETGVRDPGFTGNKGGQLRATLSRDFDRGSLSFDVKRLDDTVVFYTGIPMRTYANGDIKAVPGFDGNYGTLTGPETSMADMKMGDGSTYHYDNTVGTQVKRTQLTGHFDFEVAEGWKLKSTLRYNDTTTQRNGMYPNTLLSAAKFLDQNKALIATVPGATALQLRYNSTPTQTYDTLMQNGNGLVTVAGLRGITMPVKEVMSDNQISHRFDLGSQTHDVTFGAYFAHIDESFSRYSSSYVTDVQDNARLLNLVAVDGSGNLIKALTENGVWRYGYEWENASGEQTTYAAYLADEWQITPDLRVDGGLRWETMTARGRVEQKKTVNLGTLTTSQILMGNGTFATYDQTFDHTTWTLGANYQFDTRSGLFARYTSAARMPSLGNYVTSATAKPIIQTMDLGEAGYKFRSRTIDLYATLFWTQYHNVAFSNYKFDVITGVSTSEAAFANTETLGLELEAAWRPLAWFDVTATATLEDPQYKGLTYTDSSNHLQDYDGNQLIRVPKTSLRVVPGFNLLDDHLRLQAAVEYEGERFVDTANSVKLPDYTAINLSARYKVTDDMSLYAYIDNATNSLGLTEGNPRAGELASADAGANTFIARPLLGRNYRLALMYKF
ncbi:TonB-dependent receptor [Asticcacaulis sp. 201]|uniref:TonB-dependent receptor n=1 Tax=Asticcacaulis sp. 201 TaxID=3028787 RepID=UPI00291700A5|nr:TonB-dependent receptor [Asticcacaulis sp. 201]MDV6330700.1 TonB-dependent receptor [Asticcacaulis sp. 201]